MVHTSNIEMILVSIKGQVALVGRIGRQQHVNWLEGNADAVAMATQA